MEHKFSSWHQINVREHRVGSLYTLINNTSPEDPQRTTYVNVWQSIRMNLNLFPPLCNHGDFRFSQALDWNMIYTNAGLNLRKDLLLQRAYDWRGRENQDKIMPEWPVSWSRFQPSWMQGLTTKLQLSMQIEFNKSISAKIIHFRHSQLSFTDVPNTILLNILAKWKPQNLNYAGCLPCNQQHCVRSHYKTTEQLFVPSVHILSSTCQIWLHLAKSWPPYLTSYSETLISFPGAITFNFLCGKISLKVQILRQCQTEPYT